MRLMLRRKEKATAGVFSAGFRLGDGLDIAADVYHGVRYQCGTKAETLLIICSLCSGPS